MNIFHKYLAITMTAAMTAAAVLPVYALTPMLNPDMIRTESPETEYDAMTALGELVSVRSGPGMEYEEIDTLAEGEIVHVSQEQFNTEEGQTWCFITFGDISGWVLLSALDIDYPEDGYFLTSSYVEYEVLEETEDDASSFSLSTAVEEILDLFVGDVENITATESYSIALEQEDVFPVIYLEPSLDGEKYEEYDETGFQLVQTAPLSTFSADVDTASYANVRRIITDGYAVTQIPEDAVRAEEFVNYFSYDLDAPEDGEMFSVTIEASACPWNEDHDLMMIGIRAKDEDVQEIRQNLVFLVDISGSMWSDDKLPLAKKSMLKLLETLSPEDTISIVTYASGEDLLLDGVHPTERMLGHIKAKINQLEADGSTAGEKGLQMAYEVAQENYIEGGNNRIILMTDGDLNVGISDPDDLERFITEKAKTGVYLSALGFGEGNLRDDAIERLADCGNGNYSYIDSTLEAKKVLIDEAASTLFTVANDVKFQIEFNPDTVNAYRLIGYENRRMADTDFKDDTKDAGEIGAGYEMIALYELIPADSDAAIDLRYSQEEDEKTEEDGFSDELGMLSIRWKENGQEEADEKNVIIYKDVYTDNPSDAFRFAAAVTEFAQTIRGSENNGNGSLEHVYDTLKELTLDDEYKEEFKYLVRTLLGRE